MAGAALVIDGATPAMVIKKFCVASGETPLVAVTLKLPNVPIADGVPLILFTPSKVRPVGSVPLTVKVGAGFPVAVNVWLYTVPMVPFGGAELVIAGATLAAAILIEKFCVASGEAPFVAVTVPVKRPDAEGVPEMTPAGLRVKPLGRLPAVTEYVIVADPVAV